MLNNFLCVIINYFYLHLIAQNNKNIINFGKQLWNMRSKILLEVYMLNDMHETFTSC